MLLRVGYIVVGIQRKNKLITKDTTEDPNVFYIPRSIVRPRKEKSDTRGKVTSQVHVIMTTYIDWHLRSPSSTH